MKISRLKIENFRGIKSADLLFPDHVVLLGDNNTGKSTILEAIDLVLGPDRLSRRPPIDEHDFYTGRYFVVGDSDKELDPNEEVDVAVSVDEADSTIEAAEPDSESVPEVQEITEPETVQIKVEATISKLSDEQKAHFRDYIEFWSTEDNSLYAEPEVESIDADTIIEALRVTFIGEYDFEEDDFVGNTYFSRSLEEGGTP